MRIKRCGLEPTEGIEDNHLLESLFKPVFVFLGCESVGEDSGALVFP
jgi:hypothetical protein